MTIAHLNQTFLIPGVHVSGCGVSKGPAIGDKYRLSVDLEDTVMVEKGDLLTVTELQTYQADALASFGESTSMPEPELVSIVFEATEIRHSRSGNRLITWTLR